MNKTDPADNYDIETEYLPGMIFNGMFNQNIFEARLLCSWTGKQLDRQWAYTADKAIAKLKA